MKVQLDLVEDVGQSAFKSWLSSLRLNKIEKPKLVRQTARLWSVDNLQDFYFNNTLEKYYLELIKQNS